MESNNKNFHTARAYSIMNKNGINLTASMEDYLEMIYRLSHKKGFTRISDLARSLHVQPPSASKMVNKLADMNYLTFEKYGIIQLNEQGMSFGKYLLDRHHTIEEFLKLIGVTDNVLEQTEKIEHCINDGTLLKIRAIIDFSQENPQVIELYKEFLLSE